MCRNVVFCAMMYFTNFTDTSLFTDDYMIIMRRHAILFMPLLIPNHLYTTVLSFYHELNVECICRTLENNSNSCSTLAIFLAIFWFLHFQRAARSTFQTCILIRTRATPRVEVW